MEDVSPLLLPPATPATTPSPQYQERATGGGHAINVSPGPPRRDCLSNRLDSTLGVLRECSALVSLIEDRITGPRPTGASEAQAGPAGLGPLTIELSEAAYRLRGRLTEILNAIGD